MKYVGIAALVLISAGCADGGSDLTYASDDRVLEIGPGYPAGRTGTLEGFVIRRGGSPLCNNPVVERERIICSVNRIDGPVYDIRSEGTLSGFVVQDAQRREVCSDPKVTISGDRAFIDC